MTESHIHKEACVCKDGYSIPEKLYKLSDFFNMYWDEYSKHPSEYIESWHYKAVNAIRTCRTAVLGVDSYYCPDCGEMQEIYHSCKHRFCPSCSWVDTLKWAETQQSKMMNIKHRHVVFTLPHDLHPLIRRNKRLVYNILMFSAADTFKDWMQYKFKVKCGVISVLHTFGETKDLHIHVHMIVSWGGEDLLTGEIREIGEEYVKFDFLKDKFRCKFEDALVEAFDKKKLEHNFCDRQAFLQYLKKLNRKGWIIHVEPPMQSPKEVIIYIGRYSKRACISEYKITKIEGEFITFKYKDNRDKDKNSRPKEKELRLHYREFFPRLLQHVPLPHFRIVRYYGKYNQKSKIREEYLYKNESKIEEAEENPLFCKTCNREKEYLYTIYDLRKRGDRNEEFDSNKHEHVKLNRIEIYQLRKSA